MASSTPEEGKGSGGSGKDDNEEDGCSKDDSSSEDSFFDKLICESDSESEKKDSDVEYDSDVLYEDIIRGDDEHYPITTAILRDDARGLLACLPRTDEGKPDCNMPMGMYISLLHRSCMLRKLNCVKALIRGGCNIMAGDGTGPGIPFHLACSGYSLPLIKFMIDDARSKGQDTLANMLCAKNSTGRTPLDYARVSPYHYAIKKLLYPPADPSSSTKAQASPSKKLRTK